MKHFRILFPLLVLALLLSACGNTAKEPSDAYIVWTKAGGAVVAIAGLVYCFI